MAEFKIDSLVREAFQTVGTGNIFVLGAVGNARTFASFLTTNGDYCWYFARKEGQSEEGVLTRVSATEYARTVWRSSVNTTSPIDFLPGDGEIYCDVPAAALKVLNPHLTRSGLASFPAATGQRVFVEEVSACYRYDAASVETANAWTIITAAAGGRWIIDDEALTLPILGGTSDDWPNFAAANAA